MVLDWVTDREATLAELTKRFGHTDVYVRVNGKVVPNVWYVDEQAGVVRCYSVNQLGQRLGSRAILGKVQVIAGKQRK